MSRIRNCLTVAAGAAAGLFLGALASSAVASADVAPINPGLPSVLEQVVASSATIPQQLLQTTASALSGSTLAPAAAPAQSPIATATFNVPPTQSTAAPAGTSGLSGLPASLGSMLPFPMPNFGGAAPAAMAPTAMAPTSMVPGAFMPAAAAAPIPAASPMEVVLIPGLP
ncbi:MULTISPECIES: hypothetical protein [Mycolicibacter]|uniref:Uncharacterized protein n=1 Tax=[Mycobacterium] vasticus TaxID=2875777 RepID=A0ABU5YWA7_9MYCO|nr:MULTISPECIES: hypothetical protein [unclassified Mycolicibacter]MEB3064831.1 hypothetical protein [Mycolicibacter sp. MYC101]MEB3069382.1 hypothetical protein [Mycolicibacter sp. MYC017]